MVDHQLNNFIRETFSALQSAGVISKRDILPFRVVESLDVPNASASYVSDPSQTGRGEMFIKAASVQRATEGNVFDLTNAIIHESTHGIQDQAGALRDDHLHPEHAARQVILAETHAFVTTAVAMEKLKRNLSYSWLTERTGGKNTLAHDVQNIYEQALRECREGKHPASPEQILARSLLFAIEGQFSSQYVLPRLYDRYSMMFAFNDLVRSNPNARINVQNAPWLETLKGDPGVYSVPDLYARSRFFDDEGSIDWIGKSDFLSMVMGGQGYQEFQNMVGEIKEMHTQYGSCIQTQSTPVFPQALRLD